MELPRSEEDEPLDLARDLLRGSVVAPERLHRIGETPVALSGSESRFRARAPRLRRGRPGPGAGPTATSPRGKGAGWRLGFPRGRPGLRPGDASRQRRWEGIAVHSGWASGRARWMRLTPGTLIGGGKIARPETGPCDQEHVYAALRPDRVREFPGPPVRPAGTCRATRRKLELRNAANSSWHRPEDPARRTGAPLRRSLDERSQLIGNGSGQVVGRHGRVEWPSAALKVSGSVATLRRTDESPEPPLDCRDSAIVSVRRKVRATRTRHARR